MVALQMLHVAAGLLSVSNLSYFNNAGILSTGLQVEPYTLLSSATYSVVLWRKNKNGLGSTFKIADPWSAEKCP